MIWFGWMLVVRWLWHIHFLFKIIVKEGIVDVKLLETPFVSDCYCKNQPYCSELNNWTISLMKIKAFNLIESPSHQSNFSMSKGPFLCLLTLNTHQQDTMLALDGRTTWLHVLLELRAHNSSSTIAALQSGEIRASLTSLGSTTFTSVIWSPTNHNLEENIQ